MITFKNIKQLAEHFSSLESTKTRDNGAKFISYDLDTDNNREDQFFQDCCRDAHLGKLPDDFCYSVISDILTELTELVEIPDNAEDALEYLDSSNCIEADIYTSDLFEWAKSNYEYCDQAVSEFGNQNSLIVELLQSGQYLHKREILSAFIHSIFKNFEFNDDI